MTAYGTHPGGREQPHYSLVENKNRLVQDESMTRVFLADGQAEERSALRLMLQDLDMKVVGEAADWETVLDKAPATQPDMLLVDFSLIHSQPAAALAELRLACSNAITILPLSHMDDCEQVVLSAGADGFINKNDFPENVAMRLRRAARHLRQYK